MPESPSGCLSLEARKLEKLTLSKQVPTSLPGYGKEKASGARGKAFVPVLSISS